MKSTFHSAILALALSVSAAPVEKYSTADNNVHPTTPHVTRGSKGPGDDYGPPTFFADDPSAYKAPAHDSDLRNSSPSAKPPATLYPVPGNSTTTSSPAITTSTSNSTSHGLEKRGSQGPSDDYGPPTFFADDPSAYKAPAHDSDLANSSPSAKPPGTIYPVPGNSTTSSSPAITTGTSNSTSHSLDKRFYAASRIVTPNVNNYVSKAGTLMFGMQNPVCSEVTLIFARGTTEVGNMGTCVGPELAEALRKEIPSLSVQGVDYPANSEGNTRYGASGGPYMAMLAREAHRQCPDTKIVLAGYSQGARCIHGALEKSEHPVDGSEISAVVAFGDPLNGENEFKHVDRQKVLQVCGDSDDRCQHGQVDQWVHGGHISYGSSAKEVARWIKKAVQ